MIEGSVPRLTERCFVLSLYTTAHARLSSQLHVYEQFYTQDEVSGQ